jgi:hypothetical protein
MDRVSPTRHGRGLSWLYSNGRGSDFRPPAHHSPQPIRKRAQGAEWEVCLGMSRIDSRHLMPAARRVGNAPCIVRDPRDIRADDIPAFPTAGAATRAGLQRRPFLGRCIVALSGLSACSGGTCPPPAPWTGQTGPAPSPWWVSTGALEQCERENDHVIAA